MEITNVGRGTPSTGDQDMRTRGTRRSSGFGAALAAFLLLKPGKDEHDYSHIDPDEGKAERVAQARAAAERRRAKQAEAERRAAQES